MDYNSNKPSSHEGNHSYSSSQNYSGSNDSYIPVMGSQGICRGTCRTQIGCTCRKK